MLAVFIFIFPKVYIILLLICFNDISLVFYKVIHKLHIKSQVKGNGPVVGHKIPNNVQCGFCVDSRPVWKFSLNAVELDRFKFSGFAILKITSLFIFC